MILPTNYGHIDKIGWSRSSRTDKGVHSLATVVSARLEGMWTRVERGTGHFEYEIDGECASLPEKINQHLPPEIRVVAAAQVPYHFDARKACIHRHYEYLIPASTLEGSAYTEDREAWERILQMFVGRHHWHNFGHIERSRKLPRRVRGDVREYADEVTDEGAEASQTEDSNESENLAARDTTQDLPELSRQEPSLLDIAPGKGTSRPSLYALDDLKAHEANNPPPSPNVAEFTSQAARTDRRKPQHVPQFAGSAKFRAESDAANAGESAADRADVADYVEAVNYTRRLSKLSPLEVASLPLDDHLAQDAFFRTISAIAHDVVTVKGEKYVRVSIQGDSFLLHQVRRMIGAMVLTARGDFSEEVLRAAIDSPFRILTPRAPSRGLLLRDARFLELDWKGRDAELTRQFSSSLLYPHMHDQWNSASMLEGEAEEIRSLDLNSTEPGIWDELHSMTPVPEVRDIIPGYDEWLEWHYKENHERELKRNQRRAHYESSDRRGRSKPQITTRASF